jgi:histone H3/H4
MGDPTPIDGVAVETIMGQYIFAAGAGANGQWIRREAIQLLRNHYLPSIQKAVSQKREWGQDAVWILHYLNVIGRYAAQKATDDGRDSISAQDLKQAIASVEANYRADATGGPDVDPTGEGVWCNP